MIKNPMTWGHGLLTGTVPASASRTWFVAAVGSLVALTVWYVWQVVTGHPPTLWSVAHAPNTPLGYTTFGGLIPALAASGTSPVALDPNLPNGPGDGPGQGPGGKPGDDPGEDPGEERESTKDWFKRKVDIRDDVPFWFPKGGDMWTERQLKRVERWVMRGDGEASKAARAALSTLAIAPLGIGVYAEDALRNNWIVGGLQIGR